MVSLSPATWGGDFDHDHGKRKWLHFFEATVGLEVGFDQYRGCTKSCTTLEALKG